MRTTVIEEIAAERADAYDPEYHDLIESRIELETSLVDAEEGKIILDLDFGVSYFEKDTSETFGNISGRARLIVEMDGVDPQEDGSVEVSDEVQHVISGAFEDDVLLSVSLLARSMRLPNPVRLPPPTERSSTAEPEEPAAEDQAPS